MIDKFTRGREKPIGKVIYGNWTTDKININSKYISPPSQGFDDINHINQNVKNITIEESLESISKLRKKKVKKYEKVNSTD
jgi:RNA-splicing ligase RtcB